MKYLALTYLIVLTCITTHCQTVYTFIGNGYWTNAANWQSQSIPPDTLLSGSTIEINTAPKDSCVLNKMQIIAAGGILNVLSGSKFIIQKGMTITGSSVSVTTIAPTGVSGNYALSGGNIISNGGSAIEAKGVVWSVSPAPVISVDSKTIDGNGNTNYQSYLRNLLPNTVYFIRAYARNSIDTVYGNELSFTTTPDLLPVVMINSVDTIQATTASAEGQIISDRSLITSYGFCWDTARLPTIALPTKAVAGKPTISYMWAPLSLLIPKATYYIRAYATNMFGTAYSDEYSFTTDSLKIPSVTSTGLSGNFDAFGSIDGNALGSGFAYTNGKPVTARGICWDSLPNPVIESSDTTMAGSGAGSFSGVLKNLRSNTTYYVRAYATNAIGTGYGEAMLVRSWMAANLDVVTYRNGDTIPQVLDAGAWANLTTGAWCYYDGDSTGNAKYGKLYNFYALNDPRGLAPSGWRLPTEDDWTGLTNVLVWDAVTGGKMKSLNLWMAPNTAATNSSRFTGLPGGFRLLDGNFADSRGYYGEWWSDYRFGYLSGRRLSYNSGQITQSYTNVPAAMRIGRSVRCVRE